DGNIVCYDCDLYHPSCQHCFITSHLTLPLHWAKVWNIALGCLQRHDISTLGHTITLGHYGKACQFATPSQAMTIMDTNGIHPTRMSFCIHSKKQPMDKVGQLLEAQMYPSTMHTVSMAFTFRVLKKFNSSTYDFVGSLARMTDNAFTEDVPDVYENFICVSRLWGVLAMEKHLGQVHGIDDVLTHHPKGNLVLMCPLCPEPSFNMDPHLRDLPPHLRFMVFIAIFRDTLDGNFHCNKGKKNTDPTDVSLSEGKSYFPHNEELKSILKNAPVTKEVNCSPDLHRLGSNGSGEQKSTCNYLKAVNNQDKKKLKNMEIMGVVNTQCSHVFVKASVDLQFGEWYGL
ncbi:hypothetical protein B0H10DRAFT_1828264, partial [Mycena sp. CBHHK59/15]